MDSLHEKVVKLTAEILNKSWKPEPGKVTPFSSSSSMHQEQDDNHLEHFVQKDPKSPLEGAIANIFNSNFWMNGGENKMTETTTEQYENPGTSTTEPDPQSEIAITKMDRPKDSADLEGEKSYSTTANTAGAPLSNTTEPTQKAADDKEEDNEDKMEKAKACPHCGQSMPNDMKKAEDAEDKEEEVVEKAADEAESKEEEAKETEEDEKKEMKKSHSVWQGAFSPDIKRGM